MTKLLLVRHGQTEANETGIWHGWEETPLTALGRRQAAAIAQRIVEDFAPGAIYSSPLSRARDTAKPIAEAVGQSLLLLDDLREINFGQIGGLTLEQFSEQHPEAYAEWRTRRDLDFQWPGGENRRAFYERVKRGFDYILAQHPGGEVVVVTHGGTLRMSLAHLLPEQFSDWRLFDLGNACLTVVEVGAGGNRLHMLNDCSHLQTLST